MNLNFTRMNGSRRYHDHNEHICRGNCRKEKRSDDKSGRKDYNKIVELNIEMYFK